jgi:hypothetical protein
MQRLDLNEGNAAGDLRSRLPSSDWSLGEEATGTDYDADFVGLTSAST